MSTTSPSLRRGLSRVIVLLAAAATTTAVMVAARATADDDNPVITPVSTADRAAALAHWTPERMRQWADRDSLPPAEKIGRIWDGPPPAGVGRLFFTASPGTDESCTATLVSSSSKDIALTAGHCVNGGFDRLDRPIKIVNVVFVPGYDRGKAPHGVFPVRAFAWPGTYSGPTSSTDDTAVLALDPVDGHHAADVAGTQAISFDNPPSPVDTTILGYPLSRLAGGEALLSCARPAILQTNSAGSTWDIGCDLAGGASGGPWLRNFDTTTGKGTIFGVTSRGTLTDDLATHDLTSSAFTDSVRKLYEQADNL